VSRTGAESFIVDSLNIGNLERALRIVAGLGLIGLAAGGVIGTWGYVGYRAAAHRSDRVVPAVPGAGHSNHVALNRHGPRGTPAE
jgi:hypothetical protein